MAVRRSILLGVAQEIPAPMKVNQVRMDAAGKIGLIISETPEGWGVQVGDAMLQVVPKAYQDIFEQTTFYLGEL